MGPENKSQWRARLRARRLSMDDGDRNHAAAGLASVGVQWVESVRGGQVPGTVCAYLSVPAEPPTTELLAALHDAGHALYVPVCEAGFAMSWTPWTPGVPLAKSTFAPVREPVGPRSSFAGLGRVAGIFLPALAADQAGVRLGQGGGYYDRFLAKLAVSGAPVPTAAVVNEWELVDAGLLPHEALDRPVDYVLTPSRVVACGN